MSLARVLSRCSRLAAVRASAVRAGSSAAHEHFNPVAHGMGYHHPDMSPDKGYSFFSPTQALMGYGSLQGAADEVVKLGFKHALIVTDRVLVQVGAIRSVTDMLTKIGVKYTIYDGCEPNPTVDQVHTGVKLLKDNQCDFIVSFGGGSPHDCAKGIGLVATNGGSITDYEGVNKGKVPMMPMVAFNTTAGTAAEMTRFSIITDSKRHVKMAIIDNKITPMIAVNDPSLHMGMPPSLTAATGMDALTHAVEAFVSIASNPVTDACALHAIRLINSFLEPAVKDGNNKEARDMMASAEYLAGMAFNSAGLGYVHAMAHQLGGFYNLPHGVCNAILLPVICEFNASKVPELFGDIALAMDLKPRSDEEAVALVLNRIRELSKAVGIPPNLKGLGVNPSDFDTLATNALKDACGTTNPRVPSHGDVVALFRQAFEGEKKLRARARLASAF